MTKKQRAELVDKGLSLPLRLFMGSDKAGMRAEMLRHGCRCDNDASTWVFPDFPTMKEFAKRVGAGEEARTKRGQR
jgi:hypothetical protein